MHIRIRGNTAYLMVSKYMKLAENGVGGRSVVSTFAKLPKDSLEIPHDLLEQLSLEDIDKLARLVIEPAKQRAIEAAEKMKAQRAKDEMHAVDPNWRLNDVRALLLDVVEVQRLNGPSLSSDVLKSVLAESARVALQAHTNSNESSVLADFLKGLGGCLESIAERVSAETFPVRVENNLKDEVMHQAWSDLNDARDVLQRSLQVKGYVKTKKAKARDDNTD